MDIPEFAIRPQSGIGPILLGMTSSEVEAALASFNNNDLDTVGRPAFDRAFLGSLQIEYDDQQRCWSVGTYWSPGCGYDSTLNGEHIQSYSASELFELIAKLESADHAYDEQKRYDFPDSGLILFDHSRSHDYRDNGQRVMYGEIIVCSNIRMQQNAA